MIAVILEYLRMVSYAIVALTSLNGIKSKKYNDLLFVSDIILALMLLLASILKNLFSLQKIQTDPFILTPAVLLWAIIHFKNLVEK